MLFVCLFVGVFCGGPQLERAEVRLEGIDTMLKLAAKSFLLPSVQYAMLCGWQRVVPEGSNIGYARLTLDRDVTHLHVGHLCV